MSVVPTKSGEGCRRNKVKDCSRWLWWGGDGSKIFQGGGGVVGVVTESTQHAPN